MRKILTFLPVLTLCVWALAVGQVAAGQQSTQSPGQTYTWNGELVALDQTTRAISVKTQLLGDEGRKDVTNLKPGDRMMLTWSGFDDRAHYVLRAARYDGAKKMEGRFTFPAEFVSSEAGATGIQYITFKTQVPAASMIGLRALKPGEWVTVTARQNPATEADAVAAVRPFVVSPSSNTN
jgi:hypothetical protein